MVLTPHLAQDLQGNGGQAELERMKKANDTAQWHPEKQRSNWIKKGQSERLGWDRMEPEPARSEAKDAWPAGSKGSWRISLCFTYLSQAILKPAHQWLRRLRSQEGSHFCQTALQTSQSWANTTQIVADAAFIYDNPPCARKA